MRRLYVEVCLSRCHLVPVRVVRPLLVVEQELFHRSVRQSRHRREVVHAHVLVLQAPPESFYEYVVQGSVLYILADEVCIFLHPVQLDLQPTDLFEKGSGDRLLRSFVFSLSEYDLRVRLKIVPPVYPLAGYSELARQLSQRPLFPAGLQGHPCFVIRRISLSRRSHESPSFHFLCQKVFALGGDPPICDRYRVRKRNIFPCLKSGALRRFLGLSWLHREIFVSFGSLSSQVFSKSHERALSKTHLEKITRASTLHRIESNGTASALLFFSLS